MTLLRRNKMILWHTLFKNLSLISSAVDIRFRLPALAEDVVQCPPSLFQYSGPLNNTGVEGLTTMQNCV